MKDKTWAKQDLAMAKLLKDYGFTRVSRSYLRNGLNAYFDNGGAAYKLPWLCFMDVIGAGDALNIDDLIEKCGERAYEVDFANMAKQLKEYCECNSCVSCGFLRSNDLCAFCIEPAAWEV